MSKRSDSVLRLALLSSATMAAMFGGGTAFAQQGQPAAAEDETVVVTGSYIRGTPENTALPVHVITAEDMLDRGAPTALDLIKTLPESSGVLGDTNQFDARAQGSEGSGSVNLRGLGPQRTLVLLNGHRMVLNPFAIAAAGAVDTNTIPIAAIGRVEVLKEGAAATYGSDAIAGVVNFITRDDVQGLELGGDYESVQGGDGDYDAHALWGWHGDRARLVLSLAGQHRSEVPMLERDWALKPYIQNPQGGWSAAGAPNAFISPLTGQRFRDPGCATLGGEPGITGAAPSYSPVCYWQYTKFDNLIEEEDRYQVFADFNVDLTDKTQFHLDALYAQTISGYNTSPSYALLQTPTPLDGAVGGQYFVPATNPGLAAFITANTPAGVPGIVASTGAATTVLPAAMGSGLLYIAGRPYALGGNPLFGHGAVEATRKYNAFRISTGLNGEFDNGITWDFDLTYGQEEAYRDGRDTVVNRFQRALRGLGGPACPTIGGTPGAGGCMWFNPFASGIPANGITGVANPGYNGSLGSNENAALINWFFPNMYTRDTATLATIDLVFSGSTGWELPGGEVRWAAGMQNRTESYERELSNFNNIDLNPCIDSVDFNVNNCAVRTGALGFLGSSSESSLSRDIFAAFGELSVPFTDALQLQLAARYEDYGGNTGTTFDPKASLRWQLMDDFALRASVGTTFRGPALTSTTNGNITALQSILGTFRAVDIFGNPNLDPETATTYSFGGILDTGPIFATLDFWRFDFDNPIVTEPLAGMVATMFPGGSSAQCGNPALAALQARFTFNASGCGGANIIRVHTDYVNGAAIQNSGVDGSIRWEFDGGIAGGSFALGAAATYVLEYKVGATSVAGVAVAPAFEATGKLNYQTTVYPVPRIRGNTYIEWGNESQNLRLTMNYVDGYKDQRTEPYVGSAATCSIPANSLCATPNVITAGKEIDDFITYDLNYRMDVTDSTTFTLGVQNLTDQDPPFARLDLNYDPFTADGTGRTVRVGLRQRFN